MKKFFSKKVLFVVPIALILLASVLLFKGITGSDSSKKIRVGIIQYFGVLDAGVDGFKSGMEDLGYEEGRDIVYEYGTAEGDADKMAQIARDYISKDMDLIYAYTSVSGRVALAETDAAGRFDIPIIYGHADHPVETGLAKSMQSSGNNATGIAVNLSDLTARKLEFLLEIDPAIRNIGVFVGEHSDPAADFAIAELRRQAPGLGITIVEFLIKSPPGPQSAEEMKNIAAAISPGQIDGLFAIPGPVVANSSSHEVVVETTRRLGIPDVAIVITQVENGSLLAYAHDHFRIGEQVAVMADKVIKGANPSDMPLESPDKNILAVNLSAAKEIGLVVPESLLGKAGIILGD